ncbi:MAG: glycosyltransferase family 1 protein [Nitrospira bacterium HGW-Nitrospira-1]|nr:MAG: glycosyltransferase family 1 protein [Nitrospira bacterium HGW-Nitrospira-1]
MKTILHTESSEGWGGQEIRIIRESLGMIKSGYRVIIAAPEQSNIFRRAKELNIYTFPAQFQKKNPLSFVKILSLINNEGVNIVNTHSSSDSWVATISARLSRVRPKVIRTRHLSTSISRSYLSRLIYNWLPDAIITTGEEIRQRMIMDNGFDAGKIFSIPTGIDLDMFNIEKVKPAIQRDGYAVGMVGVLRSWKGHNYFIEAIPLILKAIPDASFYIVGDGPQYRNIKGMIENLGLTGKVFMQGHREDIPEIIASLDVLVHPSYANEGVPQSILQAMAMQRPVVASDAGAIKEAVIDEKTGFLIVPKKPEQIAERVIEFYRKPELRRKFGKEGRRFVKENYSFEKMLDKIEALYKMLLSNA